MQSARVASFFALSFATWLLLSGHLDPFMLLIGVAARVLVTIIAFRMGALDDEGHPVQLAWRFLFYLPWLAWQIVLANVAVARTILAPRGRLDPGSRWVSASQKTSPGMVAFANSITLTPGTVSLSVQPGKIHVHALDRHSLDELGEGEMDRRVRAVEGDG